MNEGNFLVGMIANLMMLSIGFLFLHDVNFRKREDLGFIPTILPAFSQPGNFPLDLDPMTIRYYLELILK